MMPLKRTLLALLSVAGCLFSVSSRAEEKPIRALLVTGGCCHDYTQQKKLLTEGISARANVVWSVVHEGDGTTDHRASVYNDPDWSKNYDVIVHDECFADVKDAAFVRNILEPHRQGLPAVNLHCAMHSYRVSFDEFKEWFEFTGVDSRSHGPQLPISLIHGPIKHPILEGLTNWTTGNEELYNTLQLWKTVTPLIYGKQGGESNAVAWVNDYRGTRVFSTTIGHNNATVGDPRYLDLVTRGLLWSLDKLNPTYLKPAVRRKAQKMVRVPINLALNKKASAPVSQEGHPAEHAFDGDSDTRWCAPDNDNNYSVQVDLGKPEEIVGTRISWEKESAHYQYTISGSADGRTWRTLLEEKKGPRPGMDEQKFSAQEIRYVKLTVTTAPPGAWASFFEFEVLGKETVEKPASLFDSRLQGMQSPAGLEQSYYAGPPNISYPTCLEATPWGDVFVGVDQNGSLDREKNRGWVVRCRDTTGDGTADEFVTFAKMDSPRGLVFDDNTLYVMHPPFLSAFHDETGDGVADRSEVLVSGLGKDLDFRGADHTCNGVRLGIDGFLYIALGDYGALKATGKDGKEIQVHGGGIVRVRPDGTDLEVVVVGTRNTYDVAIDPFMNLFTCDNTNDGDEWNLRLSHMIATGHYGYPSLYKHFAKEIMPTMKDFGGGSPTGAIFLDEPGFPDGFGHGLYTCQWGWNNVSRHALQPKGATFTADKETFVRIPRPTGIAADGLGHIYVASWNNGGFNESGPNVGFVARVAALENETKTLPVLKTLPDIQLIELLASPSGVQRLHAQREILRREPTAKLINAVAERANSTRPLAIRAAAVFTLGQIPLPAAAAPLLALSNDPKMGEFALRALADSKVASKTRAKIFADALESDNSRVRLQAIIALNRMGRSEMAGRLLPLSVDPDPAISHAAFRALIAFQSAEVCLAALDKADAPVVSSALRILGNIHELRVVEGLIGQLSNPQVPRMEILETLCRLYHKEDNWDGSWWSTRPDSTGPYFKPVSWEGTGSIVAVLAKELQQTTASTQELFALFQKYRIGKPAIPATSLELLVKDATAGAGVRRTALLSLAKLSELYALKALTKCSVTDKQGEKLTDEFVRDLNRSKNLPLFVNAATNDSTAEAELASGILLAVSRNTNAPAPVLAQATETVERLKTSAAMTRAKARFFPQDLNRVLVSPEKGEAIANIPYEEVLKLVTGAKSNPQLGKQLFESTGCAKCHTVTADQPPAGPFLGDIFARYNMQEILESILKPNAKIAQGFETTAIESKDGESLDGFVVRESGDELELRNIAGSTIIPKKNIGQRQTRPTSIMPEGLVDQLAPEELASLLHYLKTPAP